MHERSPVSDEVLVALIPQPRQTVVGWFFPDQSIVTCPLYRHLDVLPQQYRDRYDELVQNYLDEQYEILSQMDPDDHPEMHRFDPESDAECDVKIELRRDGYFRFGIWEDTRVGLRLEMFADKDDCEKLRSVIEYVSAAIDIKNVQYIDSMGKRQKLRL